MDDAEVGKLWNANAEAWTHLARAGYDICRDICNTPGFMNMLPPVKGLHGLDAGCGEGHHTRLIAREGASMTGIDIAETFIRHAREEEDREPLGIDYRVASVQNLPFEDQTFDFAVATMSLMDMPNHPQALSEIFRVLKPGGFFQFSIEHPCFTTPIRYWVNDEKGERHALAVSDYFKEINGEVQEWIFGCAPDELKAKYPKFKVPRFRRTVSGWLNLLVEAGFQLDAFEEPTPSDEDLKRYPGEVDMRMVAFFLIIRCVRPV